MTQCPNDEGGPDGSPPPGGSRGLGAFGIRHWDFVILSSFVIGHSSFVLGPSLALGAGAAGPLAHALLDVGFQDAVGVLVSELRKNDEGRMTKE